VLSQSDAFSITIASLPVPLLGGTVEHAITLSADAAGHGWFIDPTPSLNEEFVLEPGHPHELLAALGSRAAGRVDLLTVVAHELGHILGLGDTQEEHSLMGEALPLGVRRLVAVPQPPFVPLTVAALSPFHAQASHPAPRQRTATTADREPSGLVLFEKANGPLFTSGSGGNSEASVARPGLQAELQPDRLGSTITHQNMTPVGVDADAALVPRELGGVGSRLRRLDRGTVRRISLRAWSLRGTLDLPDQVFFAPAFDICATRLIFGGEQGGADLGGRRPNERRHRSLQEASAP
jgi:hypothetical protein